MLRTFASFAALGFIATFSGCGSGDVGGDPAASREDDLGQGTAFRIDVAGLDCGNAADSCPAGLDKCECMTEFEPLNYAKPHLVAVASNLLKDRIHARGNFIVAYYDKLNDGFNAGKTGGAAAADLMAQLGKQFEGTVPRYVLLNEISKEQWTSRDPNYRRYVLSLVSDLAQVHERIPIVCAPFGLPAQYSDGADWADLAKVAYVADEIEVSGAEVEQAAFAIEPVRKMYEDSIASWVKVGVPKDRLLVLDNFSGTPAKTTFGRDGVSEDSWRRAIEVRATAVAPLGAGGYVSYGWAGNKMHAASPTRVEWMRAYASHTLP
jgi:hypothetical protein